MIIERMATQLSLPIAYLAKLAATASHRYKEYTIPKRNGGTRTIHHPARELKLVQGWLLGNVLTHLPVHPSATAYVKGSSIKVNAERHRGNSYILRVDFRDFFPSLVGADVVAVLRANQQRLAQLNVTEQDILFIRQIVCRYDPSKKQQTLTIGAPTSPHLSNAIMFNFDETWFQESQSVEVIYTRYADDLYFSTNRPNVLKVLLERLRKSLAEVAAPTLSINESKTAFSSRKRRMLATGLVLTSDRKISIGRHKKRILKSLVLKLKHGQLYPEDVASLRGSISYVRSVEPLFIQSLQKKYEIDFSDAGTWEI